MSDYEKMQTCTAEAGNPFESSIESRGDHHSRGETTDGIGHSHTSQEWAGHFAIANELLNSDSFSDTSRDTDSCFAAEYLNEIAQREHVKADAVEIFDEQQSEFLHEEANALEQLAGFCEDGVRGLEEVKEQQEAGKLAEQVVELGADILKEFTPLAADLIIDVAAVTVKDGVREITKEAVDLNQGFTHWLESKLID